MTELPSRIRALRNDAGQVVAIFHWHDMLTFDLAESVWRHESVKNRWTKGCLYKLPFGTRTNERYQMSKLTEEEFVLFRLQGIIIPEGLE